MEGTVLQGIGSFYRIGTDDGMVYTCRAQKKLRKVAAPLPGDRVRFTPGEDTDGWIEEIRTRKNALPRPAVANVDILALVIAPVPEPDMQLIERLLLYAAASQVQPILIVNKQDLDGSMAGRIREEYSGSPLRVYETSAMEGTGIDLLRQALEGQIACFAGQSAVGKSSLLNALCDFSLETGELSRKTERGRHTTRRAELMTAGKLRIIDTPGFSLLDVLELDPTEMPGFYPEYETLAGECRFRPCMHDREPGCAVRVAVDEGRLSRIRYERYRVLLGEVRETWKERYR